jgi:hypothetical protein
MHVGLMRVRRGSPHLTSPCDGAHYGYFAAQPVWRYAASLAGSAAICRSAYYSLGRQHASLVVETWVLMPDPSAASPQNYFIAITCATN